MKLLLLILISTQAFGANPKEIDEAKRSIKLLIAPLLPGLKTKTLPKELKNFRVDGCPKQKINWMDVLMMKSKVTLEYKFQEGCDIEGSVTPKVFADFPVNLKLRNLESYHQIEAQNKVTGSFESKPVLRLDMTEGVLTGKKGTVKFTSQYEVQIDPSKPKKLVDKNLGGEISITEIYGEKVAIKERILVE
jgi:hypothetical protein